MMDLKSFRNMKNAFFSKEEQCIMFVEAQIKYCEDVLRQPLEGIENEEFYRECAKENLDTFTELLAYLKHVVYEIKLYQ
jgi:hypothetical protein